VNVTPEDMYSPRGARAFGTHFGVSVGFTLRLCAKDAVIKLSLMATHRIYYDDAYARDFTAKVLSCDAVPPDLQAGRTHTAWAVVLDRTALYPTSGGQPHDFGKLGDATVLEVRDEGDEIVHIVDRECHEGAAVSGCVDWPRRFDHMQQHTGQHLLSAIFQERAGLPTVSFHLGEDICTIDVQGPEPSEQTLEGVERAANKIIFEDRAVQVHYATPEQIAERGVRKRVEREGMLRVIEIDGTDFQPCGGTHVRTTGQIGIVMVRKVSKVRQDWRVEFVCGGRAERFARVDFRQLRDSAQALQCAPNEVPTAAQRVVAERDTHYAALRNCLQQLAEAEAELALKSVATTDDGVRVVERIFAAVHPDFPGFFAMALTKREKVVGLLAMQDSGQIFFAQHAGENRDMTTIMKHVLGEVGGKGGGTKDFARGRLADAAGAGRAIEVARTMLSYTPRDSRRRS
jgi:alanyl-tRNA synthetase